MPPSDSDNAASATGIDRSFTGSARVRATDKVATIVISAGGLSVIAAVLGICMYLLYVTVPLLTPGKARTLETVTDSTLESAAAVLIDEYLQTAAWVRTDGVIEHRVARSGELIDLLPHPGEPGGTVATLAADPLSGIIVSASSDELAWSRAKFAYTLRNEAGDAIHAEALDDGRFRIGTVSFEAIGSVAIASELVHADVFEDRRRTLVAAVDAQGRLLIWGVAKTRSLLGVGDRQAPVVIGTTAIEPMPGAVAVCLLADGQCVVVGADGSFIRAAIGRSDAAEVERGRLWSEAVEVTAVTKLIGSSTFVAATEDGQIGSWWVGFDPANGADVGRLVSGPPLKGINAPVTSLAPSQRNRTILVGDANGGVRALHASSGKTVAKLDTDERVRTVSLAPKTDGFIVVTQTGYTIGSVELGHPDVTPRSLFAPMLYEGQLEPQYVYQASGATDAAEPKLSLVPLVFGTIKATLVSMLFAAPIAVLAAIYTSEFLSKRVRRFMKPLIETMASLPSVVLGFVAAMVIAPFVADHLSVVLASFVAVPLAVLVMSGLAGLRATSASETHGSALLPLWVVATGAFGVLLSVLLAGPLESSLFGPERSEVLVLAGSVEPSAEGGGATPIEPATEDAMARVGQLTAEFDRPSVAIKSWLGGVYGSAGTGWFVLISPLAAVVCSLVVWPVAMRRFEGINDAAWEPLARVLVSCIAGAAAGAALASMLAHAGIDARESIVGAFTQRNTLVIGIVMGFAIIPIIYTISDDALQSVPANLRAASLGAGATRWQTTIRVVLPVAASGIFSATMIGLGRAVGETMIVLMATGNTPIMDWNIFEGLRTLSANIAVELPEAERGGTHYRLLFLCGIALFAMTFVVNTTAEIVRQRFRKRNAML